VPAGFPVPNTKSSIYVKQIIQPIKRKEKNIMIFLPLHVVFEYTGNKRLMYEPGICCWDAIDHSYDVWDMLESAETMPDLRVRPSTIPKMDRELRKWMKHKNLCSRRCVGIEIYGTLCDDDRVSYIQLSRGPSVGKKWNAPLWDSILYNGNINMFDRFDVYFPERKMSVYDARATCPAKTTWLRSDGRWVGGCLLEDTRIHWFSATVWKFKDKRDYTITYKRYIYSKNDPYEPYGEVREITYTPYNGHKWMKHSAELIPEHLLYAGPQKELEWVMDNVL
jgi:hypothetical protein